MSPFNDLVPVGLDTSAGQLYEGPTFLSEKSTAGRGQVRRGQGQAPLGGVHVDDARGPRPHLGTDPEAATAPLGEDGALGAEGGGGGK